MHRSLAKPGAIITNCDEVGVSRTQCNACPNIESRAHFDPDAGTNADTLGRAFAYHHIEVGVSRTQGNACPNTKSRAHFDPDAGTLDHTFAYHHTGVDVHPRTDQEAHTYSGTYIGANGDGGRARSDGPRGGRYHINLSVPGGPSL